MPIIPSLLSVVVLIAACGAVPTEAPATPVPTATLATCEPNAPLACTTLEGVPLGRFGASVSLDTPPCVDRCHDLPGTALSALERMAPNHPPVAAIDEYGPDDRALCGTAPCLTTAALGIFVFGFADATTLPIVVICVGVSPCEQVDHYGPPY